MHGPEFYPEIVDFNAGPTNVFVATKLVYVMILQLTCVSSSFVVGLSQHF